MDSHAICLASGFLRAAVWQVFSDLQEALQHTEASLSTVATQTVCRRQSALSSKCLT